MELLDKNYQVSSPKIIIFDWDNTLVDSWSLMYQVINRTLLQYGKEEWSLDDVKNRIHRSMRDTMSLYFPDNWQEVGQFFRQCYSQFTKEIKPLPDAESSLVLALNKKILCAIVSNKTNHFLLEEIKFLNWSKYFQSTIGSGDLAYDKPSPITVQETLKRIIGDINIDSEQVWFIGDTVTDMETAYNANCVPVFFGNEENNFIRYKSCMPKIWFKDHKLLSHYLEML